MQPEWIERFAWHRRGTGVLEFQQAVGVGVDWELVQTPAGALFLLVRANGSTALGAVDLDVLVEFTAEARLSGFDEAGLATRVEAEGRTNPVYLARVDGWITLRAQHAEAVVREPVVVAYRFTLVNLCLDTPPAQAWEREGAHLNVVPVAAYDEVVSTLYTRDRQAITATLTVDGGDRTHAVQLADHFCELASYANGCRVQWLHLEGLNAEGAAVSAWLSARITGPFIRLPLIADAAFWPFVREQWATYQAFRQAEPAHARRLLGMLMNATSSDDFLELRGLKLASAVDALTTIVLPSPRPNPFVSNGRRDAFLSTIRQAIRDHAPTALRPDTTQTPDHQARWTQQMTDKAPELVRPAFRELIQELCDVLAIAVPPEDTAQFIRARNELVHEARYVCQRVTVPDGWPFTSPAQEYFWLLRYVDRLVLRTLGYRGPFLDRSVRGRAQLPADAPAWDAAGNADDVPAQ